MHIFNTEPFLCVVPNKKEKSEGFFKKTWKYALNLANMVYNPHSFDSTDIRGNCIHLNDIKVSNYQRVVSIVKKDNKFILYLISSNGDINLFDNIKEKPTLLRESISFVN